MQRLTDPARLDDLRRRLVNARLPDQPIRGGGETPETIRRIDELIAYWRDGYRWPAERLAALPHRFFTVDGVRIHALVVPGTGPDPLPLLLSNGWPSSFVEYLDVLDLLTGHPDERFTVVIPALPGYGLSDRALDRDLTREQIAGLFNTLMVEHLGHERYVAHGDDIGGGVVNRLGMHHAANVIAIQTTNWLNPEIAEGTALSAEEVRYRRGLEDWDRTEGAYAHVQETRPHTLAYALNDSPAGLAAWILEKWLTWTDPATRDNVSADTMLTNVTLYWLTETGPSSTRLYAIYNPPALGDVVAVPASVLAPHEPKLPIPPESWLRRSYPQLTRWAQVEAGGHFLAAENPELFAAELRNAFRQYRR